MKLHPFFLIFLLSCSSTLFAATPTETTTFNFSLNVIGAACTVSVGLDNSGGGAVIDTDGSGNAPILPLDSINLTTDFDVTSRLTKSTPFYVSFTNCTDVTQASYSFAGDTQTDNTTIHTISGDNADTIGLVISTDSALSTLLKSTDEVTTTLTDGEGTEELYLGYKWFGTKTVSDLADDKNVTSTIVLNVAYQ